jgi:hypothetical protein
MLTLHDLGPLDRWRVVSFRNEAVRGGRLHERGISS